MNEFYLAIADLGCTHPITLASVYFIWSRFSLDKRWLLRLTPEERAEFYAWWPAFQERLLVGA